MPPNVNLLRYSLVHKEAVLSSQIEGAQSSLADLLLYEIAEQPGVPLSAGWPACGRAVCRISARFQVRRRRLR